MGQYYRPILKINNRIEVLNRNLVIDGEEEYTSAKITEHSWIGNWLMETVCDKIYNSDKPVRLIWMGDYADDFANDLENTFNGLTKKQIKKDFKEMTTEEKILLRKILEKTIEKLNEAESE